MASFATLRANLNLNIQNFSDGLREASRQSRRFARNLNGELNDAGDAISRLNRNTNAWGLNMKSVSRVVSGIIISQTFYNAAQAIGGATNAAWEFTKQLEYAKIAYSNLFGDTSLALEFINVLKDFAAQTPFTFREAETSAKRLLAYGVQYENIMYVMQGVMSAASAQGDPARIEQISRAIGQIFTYGKLMTAEVRQLTEAGIPVYDILQEKLGLTQEQLRNLGHEAIPASKAINALIDGINERFGNVVTASSKTITGIISNIKDNATMLASGLMEPLTVVIKSALADLGEFLYTLRDIMETRGAGGVFEALFPASMHDTLRQFAANMAAIYSSVVSLGIAIGGTLRPLLQGLLNAFNAVAPIITSVLNGVAALTYGLTQNATAMQILTTAIGAAAAMWTIYKARAIASAAVAGAITIVSKALAGLAKMLTFVIAHPFWALLIGLTGVLVGVSSGFGNLSDKVNNFFKSLTKFNGVDPDKVLLPSQKERANDLDKFNKKLDGTADSMDDLAGSTGKAAKAAKSLLSFDEVFKLNEPDEGAGGGINDAAMEDLLGGFGGLGDAYIPEVPDFSLYIDSVLGGLRDAWEIIKEHAGVIVGTGLGFIFGNLMKGALGGILGGAVGALVGHIWDSIDEHFGLADTQKHASVISAGIQAVIQAAFGFVRNYMAAQVLGLATFNPQLIANAFSIGISGALKNGLLGAITSLGVGLLSNALTGWIAKELELTDEDLKNAGIGQMIGSIVGTITGTIIGGPIGALVGGALGQIAGSIVGEFWAYLSTTLKGTIVGGVAGLPLGALIGTIVGSIGGPLGAALGATVGTALGTLVGLLVEYWGPISEFFTNATAFIVEKFDEWFGETLKGISQWYTDTTTKLSTWWTETKSGFTGWFSSTTSSFGTWWSSTKQGFTTWFSDTRASLSGWWDNTVKTFTDWSNINSTTLGTWWSNTKQGFSTWFSETFTGVSTWWANTKQGFTTWYMDTKSTLGTWASETLLGFAGWILNTYNAIVGWKRDIELKFNQWKEAVKGIITQWISDVIIAIAGWVTDTTTKITGWISDIKTKFDGWKTQMLLVVTGFAAAALLAITSWVTNTTTSIVNWIADIKGKFNTWKSDVSGTIVGFASSTLLSITGWISNTKQALDTWIDGVKTNIKTKFDDIIGKIGDFLKLDVSIGTFCTNTLRNIKSWASDVWDSIRDKIGKAIDKIMDFISASDEAASTPAIPEYSGGSTGPSYSGGGPGYAYPGHATGGIFNREHIARFSEGDKAEMAVPLENNSAMQPFVDAISKGILEGLAPTLIQNNNNNGQSSSLPPMYIGTLVADDRGLKQLYKKFELIQAQENARKGLA